MAAFGQQSWKTPTLGKSGVCILHVPPSWNQNSGGETPSKKAVLTKAKWSHDAVPYYETDGRTKQLRTTLRRAGPAFFDLFWVFVP